MPAAGSDIRGSSRRDVRSVGGAGASPAMKTSTPVVRLRRHDPLLTLTDVCERLSVSPSTFYDWRQAHKAPPCIRLPNGQLRIAELSRPAAARRLLDRLARTIDGRPAAASTLARKRAVLHNCLDAAVEAGHLPTNPLTGVRRWRPPTNPRVDPGAVVNPELASALLAAVRADRPEFEAYFACLYFGGLRPAEARGLRAQDLVLPDEGWGAIRLRGSQQTVAKIWTDEDATRQDRPLKHRSSGEVRVVSAPPELVATLGRHLNSFRCGVEGHLFVARTGRGGHPLSPPYEVTVGANTLALAWDRARAAALTPEQYASPLARRPYDLRHAAHSTWLAAGVAPADVAARAGHSVNVLMKVYAHQIDGHEQRNRAAVEVALQRAALQDHSAKQRSEDGLQGRDRHPPPAR